MTARDVWANDVADKLAKLGAGFHRVSPTEVSRWREAFAAAKARAMWIGLATHEANNCTQFPFRDSEASRWNAMAAQRKKAERKAGVDGRRKRGPKQAKPIIPASKGGHSIELARSDQCWLCTRCKGRSTSWAKLATSKCDDTKVKALTRIAVVGEHGKAGSGRRHLLITAGTVVWCETCGSFAESRTSQRMKDVAPDPHLLRQATAG